MTRRNGPDLSFAWLIIVVVLVLLSFGGCASVPKAPVKPVVTSDPSDVIAIVELAECHKAYAYIIVTRDGAINAKEADSLSKDQIEGIDTVANALPEGSAATIDLVCVVRQKTSL